MDIIPIPVRTCSSNPPRAGWRFTAALLRATLRNPKTLAVTLGLPLFMLLTIWIPSAAGDEESRELMRMLFPAVILLGSIMPGMAQATRLTHWREQGIIQRLALTPTPLCCLAAATALAQIAVGIGQGTLMLSCGIFLTGLEITCWNALSVLGGMALAGAAFTAFGSMIAAFSKRAEIAGYVFFFTVMPLTFLASFPPAMMPGTLNAVTPWLPTSMAIELIGPQFLGGQPSPDAPTAVAGLAAFTAIFAHLATVKFRREIFM